MRYLHYLLTVVLLSLALSTPAIAAAPIPDGVEAEALRGLESFKRDAANRPAAYGSADATEVQKATLGSALQIHRVKWKDVQAANEGSLLSITTPISAWKFVVEVDGQPRTALTIALEGDRYQMVSYGGHGPEYGFAVRDFVRMTGGRDHAQVKPVLVEDGILFLVGKVGTEELVLSDQPPARAAHAGGVPNDQLKPAREAVKYLKEIQAKPSPGLLSGVAPAHTPETATSNATNRIVPLGMLALLGAVLTGWFLWKRRTASGAQG